MRSLARRRMADQYDWEVRSEVSIPPEVAATIGYYVYALRDPRDGRAPARLVRTSYRECVPLITLPAF